MKKKRWQYRAIAKIQKQTRLAAIPPYEKLTQVKLKFTILTEVTPCDVLSPGGINRKTYVSIPRVVCRSEISGSVFSYL